MAVTFPGETAFPSSTLTPGTADDGPRLVTLDEAKQVAQQVPGQAVDVYETDLLRLTSAVIRHISRQYGAPLPGSRTFTVWQQGGTVILPLGVQVVSVNSGSVSLTGWEHDEDAGLLRGVYSYGQVSVTYMVPVLPDVREAALLVLRHAWNTRWGAIPTDFGAVRNDDPAVASTPSGYFVPNRAKELLAPYGTRVA